ncbi:hydantoinase/oxoprolinase family protein [uncultured Sulfitobacter sp.]|uniref:hydantoinase/oxoprolinase family protein n=1 Tax=uncultured Sulfitobacter sp. TaxID=191468 RepID=UPI002632D6EB|nr:hydantoinase/oxoprolinase family protein [uncultured Sulfitobacter sp.]
MKRIGIDVGGTNTDAVPIDGEKILASIKVPTTSDVMSGVVSATKGVLDQASHLKNGAAHQIAEAGIRSVAVNALFSPLTSECELEAAEIIRSVVPDVQITLSHTLGRIGLLERENVAMLNASLQSIGRKTVDAFGSALEQAGIDAPFYLTQNDGTVVMAEVAAKSPVFSFASGPTNSMRGAAFLTGLEDAMVADVGGTTTDIGCLVNGFPREANNIVEVGGVRTLFRMPDLLPIGLGGGSIVDVERGRIGPRSVGYRISSAALVFGGDTLTATDLLVAAGRADIGDKSRVRHLDGAQVNGLLQRMIAMLEDSIDRMKTSSAPVDLIAVGGGSFLIPDTLAGVGKVHRMEQAGVANAIGAAMAQVSGEVDQVFSGLSRDAALAEAEAIARCRAAEAGACVGSIKTIEVEDLPIAYLPGGSRRVRVRVVGDID